MSEEGSEEKVAKMLPEEPQSPDGQTAETISDEAIVVSFVIPMPLTQFGVGTLPTLLLSHLELDALLALWTRLRGDKPLPQRSDFDLTTVKRWASHLSIATVMPTGRFQYRLFGTDLTRVYGDLTGKFLDELTPKDLWSRVLFCYQEVVRTQRPLFAPISITTGRWYSEVSHLALPLAAEGEDNKVACIMGADYARTY